MEYKLFLFFLTLSFHQTWSYFHGGWYNSPRRPDYNNNNNYNNHYDRDQMFYPDSPDDYYNPPWALTTTQRPMYNEQECTSSCQDTSTFRPVCGTNGVTYQNMNNLRCAARCGVDVRPKSWAACPRSNLNNDQTQTKTNLQACMNVCPTTPEYNPVCGTDNVTYNNIGKLNCAKECGIDVELKRQMPCPLTTTTPAPTDAPVQPSQNSRIQTCITFCPVTSEYNPVCGSNGVTYKNIGSLECARECGVDVTLRGRTACTLLSTPPTTSELPLIDRMTTKPTSFTIAQEILDSIFTRSPDDEDLEPNIDPRFNREK